MLCAISKAHGNISMSNAFQMRSNPIRRKVEKEREAQARYELFKRGEFVKFNIYVFSYLS